jgi:hypothetical protein
MLGQLLFSVVILIIGLGTAPELFLLWLFLAGIVWLPAWLVFGTVVIGLAILAVI